jgi:hypothetical protein
MFKPVGYTKNSTKIEVYFNQFLDWNTGSFQISKFKMQLNNTLSKNKPNTNLLIKRN